MGYMLIGTFLVAGSMGALELDQIGYVQFCVQSLIGLTISVYGLQKGYGGSRCRGGAGRCYILHP